MTKKGPNDASGVVWALGEFFFVFFLRFIDNNGPKWRQTRHLGPFHRRLGLAPGEKATLELKTRW